MNFEISNFWKKVDKKTDDECWLWLGATRAGYGRFHIPPRTYDAHRISYYLKYGELPTPPFYILHKCNNKPCVNPSHLYKGTQSDNKLDQILSGIRASHRGRKLSDEDATTVVVLSAQGKSQREIAKLFGVSQWNIWNILHTFEWGR